MVRDAYPSADLACKSLQHNGLHFDPPVTTKSYALQDPLGERTTASQSSVVPQFPTSTHDWQLIKQEPIEVRHMMLIVPHYLISSRV